MRGFMQQMTRGGGMPGLPGMGGGFPGMGGGFPGMGGGMPGFPGMGSGAPAKAPRPAKKKKGFGDL
jgi:signal recognition particle subunit SRP54